MEAIEICGAAMAQSPKEPKQAKADEAQIMLGLLDAVERDGRQSQRGMAAELDIALGLVNTYLARCIKKGWVKARQAPARRYFYYLTPRGFTEKSQLTAQYLSSSFGFFRQAKGDCQALFQAAQARGLKRLVLAGKSDLAEIAVICAVDCGVEIVGLVDAHTRDKFFLKLPLAASLDRIAVPFDAVVVTDLSTPRQTCEEMIARIGAERVLMPELLRIRFQAAQEKAA